MWSPSASSRCVRVVWRRNRSLLQREVDRPAGDRGPLRVEAFILATSGRLYLPRALGQPGDLIRAVGLRSPLHPEAVVLTTREQIPELRALGKDEMPGDRPAGDQRDVEFCVGRTHVREQQQ